MKRVPFKVARAIKEAGYPQKCDMYYPVPPKEQNIGRKVAQPTYIEVWLWLWREKKFPIDVDCYNCDKWSTDINGIEFDDPEEAIVSAINHLADNGLIK